MTSSVIIPTRNRTEDLSRTLPTLLEQTQLPDEIIIVDQSPDDSTKKVVQRFENEVITAGRATPKFIYLYDPSLGGAGAARNVAIDHARGDILVFLDDDVLLEPDFLQELIAVYKEDSGLGGVSGVITNYPMPSFRQRFLFRLFRTGPFHDERQSIYWSCDQLRHSRPFPVRKFGAGVMSVKRQALDRLRFDALYKGAGSEDIDLSWRISERWPLVMTPRARLFHIRTDLGRPRDHWLTYEIKGNYYLYYRLWQTGIKNRLCFAWLNVGYVLIASLGSLKRGSLGPWRAFIEGIRSGHEQIERSGPALRQL